MPTLAAAVAVAAVAVAAVAVAAAAVAAQERTAHSCTCGGRPRHRQSCQRAPGRPLVEPVHSHTSIQQVNIISGPWLYMWG